MKRIRLPLASLLILLAAVVLASSTPVFAHNGEHAEDGNTSSSSDTGSGRSVNRHTTVTKTDDNGTETEIEHTREVEVHRSSVAELKQKAQADLSKRQQSGKKLTDDQRKKVCETHKQGLQNRADHIVSNSQRIQKRIDGILQKAVDYKTSKNLTPANWDSLLAVAQSAQAASSASITTLQSVKPTVDCNNTSVAGDVATFKTAAAETRDNLKAYRDSVKAVLKALAEVKTTEGSN